MTYKEVEARALHPDERATQLIKIAESKGVIFPSEVIRDQFRDLVKDMVRSAIEADRRSSRGEKL